MSTSIIIPTRNSVPALSRCLDALFRRTTDAEILIVVNGPQEENVAAWQYAIGLKQIAPLPVSVIAHEPLGFCTAANAGLAQAQGDFLVVLHDDTVVGPGWLDAMGEALRVARFLSPGVTFGYVGPLSNVALGPQRLDPQRYPEVISEHMVEAAATRLITEVMPTGNRPLLLPVSSLGTFCLGMSRAAYEAVGGFDAEHYAPIHASAEFDLMLRGQAAGQLAIVANRAYVWHQGAQTLHREFPNAKHSRANQVSHLLKWHQPREQKVCATYRIREQSDTKVIHGPVPSLEKVAPLVDSVALLVPANTGDWPLLVQETLRLAGFPSMPFKIVERPANRGFDEVADRNDLLAAARELNPDWIWNLEPDEIPADNVTREIVQRLTNPLNPSIKAYAIPSFFFWRDAKTIRVDRAWAQMSPETLFKNEPGWGGHMAPSAVTTYDCRRIPAAIPMDAVMYTQAIVTTRHRLIHAEGRQAAYNEIVALGLQHVPTPWRNVTSYEDMYDEMKLSLVEFRPHSLALVIMARFDEQAHVVRLLQLYRDLVHEVVIQLNDWEGETKWPLDKWPGQQRVDVIHYREFGATTISYGCCDHHYAPDHMLCDFAAARNNAIQNTTSEYILFLDPDEELEADNPRLLAAILQHNWDVCTTTVANLHSQNGNRVVQPVPLPRLFKNRKEIYYTSKVHESLWESLRKYGQELRQGSVPLTIIHFGFLETNPDERKLRNDRYAQKLVEILEADPTDARALLALGVHLNDIREYDRGDVFIGKAIQADPTYFVARLELALRYGRRAIELLLATPQGGWPTDQRAEFARQYLQGLAQFYPDIAARLGMPSVMAG